MWRWCGEVVAGGLGACWPVVGRARRAARNFTFVRKGRGRGPFGLARMWDRRKQFRPPLITTFGFASYSTRVDEGVGIGATLAQFALKWRNGRGQRSVLSPATGREPSWCAPGVTVSQLRLQRRNGAGPRPSNRPPSAAPAAARRLRSAAGAGGAAFWPARRSFHTPPPVRVRTPTFPRMRDAARRPRPRRSRAPGPPPRTSSCCAPSRATARASGPSSRRTCRAARASSAGSGGTTS